MIIYLISPLWPFRSCGPNPSSSPLSALTGCIRTWGVKEHRNLVLADICSYKMKEHTSSSQKLVLRERLDLIMSRNKHENISLYASIYYSVDASEGWDGSSYRTFGCWLINLVPFGFWKANELSCFLASNCRYWHLYDSHTFYFSMIKVC